MASEEEYSGEYQFKTEDLLSTKKEDRQKKRQERRRIRHYKFSDKKHPKEAVAALIIGLCATALLIIAVVIAAAASGNAGSITGILGLFSFLVSIVGIACAMVALYKKEVKTSLAWTGLGFNGFIFLFIVCLVLIYL